MTRKRFLEGIACVAGIFLVSISYAGDFHNAMSLQGYTGLLNTPNAEVTDTGRLDLMYSNQKEPQWLNYNSEDNAMFSLGFLPYMELGGRLTNVSPFSSSGVRHLSDTIKFKLPFLEGQEYLPEVAFGAQDIGGATHFLRTEYVVLSKEIYPFRFSAGYGIGPDRLQGVFGGVECHVYDWLYLMAENDTKGYNAGVRFLTPDNMLHFPFNIGLTLKTSLNHNPGNFSFGASLQIPLGADYRQSDALSKEQRDALRASINAGPASDVFPETTPFTRETYLKNDGQEANSRKYIGEIDAYAATLQERLLGLGFENLRIGLKGPDTIFIEYENNTFNWNQMDGLGLTMGIAAVMAPPEIKYMEVVMKRMNIPMLVVRASTLLYRDFLSYGSGYGQEGWFNITHPASSYDYSDITFFGEPLNSSSYKLRVSLYPGLTKYIGTEVGEFDYFLSLETDLFMPLWKGAGLNARWDIPVAWSANFEPGRVFSSQRTTAELDRLLLQQSFKPLPSVVTMVSAGSLMKDNNGVLSETLWSPGDGTHRFGLTAGFFKDDKDPVAVLRDKKILFGSYRYYFDKLDLSVEATYGRFLYQDHGVTAAVTKNFSDVSASLVFNDNGTIKQIGISFTIPLTPRRDMKPGLIQVKGDERWTQDVHTTIGSPNVVTNEVTVVPDLLHNVENDYYNADRLEDSYIMDNMPRLRNAYATWGLKD